VKVVVVGGGVIGCASALELAKEGAEVVLLERGAPGGEASSAAAGMLAALGAGPRTPFQDLAVASWRAYPGVAAELRDRSGIDIELVRRGTVYPVLGAAGPGAAVPALPPPLAAEFGVRTLDAGETRKLEPALSPDVRGALFVEGDHWVNNERLVTAYAVAGVAAGVTMRIGTAVTRIVMSAGRARAVVTEEGEVGADAVLLAAGAWTGELTANLGARLPVAPSRGQMLALAHVPAVLGRCVHGDEAYLVPRPSGELLVGATVERVGFRREVTARGIGALIAEAVELVPALGERAITRTWCGFRPWAPDSLPILGPWPGIAGLFVATAHYRNGILLAPITARLMAEWILKGQPSLAVPEFLPDRFVRRAPPPP
jgi:glycine oxidase